MTTAPERRVFALPDLGEGLTEAEVVEWRVGVGSTVEIDQVVVEVETVKAAVEVPVPYAGAVLELHAEVGAVVAVGAPLISVAGGGAGTEPAVGERGDAQSPGGSGRVLVGYGTDHAPAGRRRRGRGGAVPSGAADGAGPAALPLVISPLVRSLAREHGVDVARLSPSGPHGVVLRRDVEQAMSRNTAAREAMSREAVAQEAPPGTVPAPTEPASDDMRRIPLRGRLRTAAEKLSRSGAVPSATTWVDVDATGLLQTREALRSTEPGRDISLLALLARICAVGLGRFPELNSTVDEEQDEIVRFSHVHLGFAAQTGTGLVVPVTRDAQRLTTAELSAELARLTAQARSGALHPRSLTGGTFTLNNYGVFGVDGSTPLLNHPEAAMLGVGRITDKPWVVDGQLAVRKVTQLSLTFDHRVCDGGTAGGFLRYVADRVERPTLLLADL
ncbi:dihydrolipoamide acetyltransferase family protein [Streptomyces sp. LN785]|uniref:dihydrolipoamide acetyltransferase family protein n=1 Tax=Streptomyces sp. LN785 TaxID=3112983 RepID=UPI0037119708